MSPTIMRIGSYRFYFLSREEMRIHVHIVSPDGEAKFWIEPIVALATYTGLTKRQLNHLQKLVEAHKNKIVKAWKNTLSLEVTNISEHGFWLFIDKTQYFLSFKHFPWFKSATIEQICNIELSHKTHLHWPDLDVDLSLEIITNPENYKLIAK